MQQELKAGKGERNWRDCNSLHGTGKELGLGARRVAERKTRHSLLSSPLSPSGLHGMKHEAESNDVDGVTVRQGQSWGAPMDGKEPESCHIPV